MDFEYYALMNEQSRTVFLQNLKELLELPSPSGYTDRVKDWIIKRIQSIASGHEIRTYVNHGIEIFVPGNGGRIERGVCSHYDTLGLYVASVGKDGKIRPGKVGGYPWSAVEGESVTIHAYNGVDYTGTVLFDKASTHIYGSAYEKEPRTNETMWIRLDEAATSEAEVKALGIDMGAFVSLRTHFEVTKSGYLKGRHLDNKGGVALLLTLLQELAEGQEKDLIHPLRIILTAGEEIGRGALFVNGLDELLIVDNAVVGEGQQSEEDKVTICVRDSTGPFNPDLIKQLDRLAKENQIASVFDIFKSYGSDAELVTRRGENTKTALIGAGISASHSYERTHLKAFEETWKLLRHYVYSG